MLEEWKNKFKDKEIMVINLIKTRSVISLLVAVIVLTFLPYLFRELIYRFIDMAFVIGIIQQFAIFLVLVLLDLTLLKGVKDRSQYKRSMLIQNVILLNMAVYFISTVLTSVMSKLFFDNQVNLTFEAILIVIGVMMIISFLSSLISISLSK